MIGSKQAVLLSALQRGNAARYVSQLVGASSRVTPNAILPLLPRNQPAQSDNQLSSQFTQLSLLKQSVMPASRQPNIVDTRSVGIGAYILPTAAHNSPTKQTILDQVRQHKHVYLPTNTSVVKEKVTPSLDSLVPMADPHYHGNATSYQCGTKWIRVIRHRKVKKHKLRKLRKRLIFLNRKLELVKKKKKEKMIQLYEKEQKREADTFDPEKFIEEKISEARKGGWYIDPLAGR